MRLKRRLKVSWEQEKPLGSPMLLRARGFPSASPVAARSALAATAPQPSPCPKTTADQQREDMLVNTKTKGTSVLWTAKKPYNHFL